MKVTHDAGFFSCSTVRLLAAIDHHNCCGGFPRIDSSEQYGRYKDEPGDVTPRFFRAPPADEPTLGPVEPSRSPEQYDDPTHLQFTDYHHIDYAGVGAFVERYFTVAGSVRRLEQQLTEAYAIDPATTIAVCFRGNDKHHELVLPTYDEMLTKLEEVRARHPGHRVLVQSDERDFCLRARELDGVFLVGETIKIQDRDHSVADAVPVGNRTKAAQVFLAVMQIMRRCDRVITTSGNVGLWICLYRGSAAGVSQHLHSPVLCRRPNVHFDPAGPRWLDGPGPAQDVVLGS